MKNIKIKETYLLFLIVMGLISMAVYSTYALFTASSTINNVVGFTASLTTNSNILEYEMVTVGPKETKIIEITVKNTHTASLYYGVWYEILTPNASNINIGLYTEKDNTASSGQIAASATTTLLVGISNSGITNEIVNIGTVGSTTSNLNLTSPRTLLTTGWNIPAKITLNALGLTLTSSSSPSFSNIAPKYTLTENGRVDGAGYEGQEYFTISGTIKTNQSGTQAELVNAVSVPEGDLTIFDQGLYMCPGGSTSTCTSNSVLRIDTVKEGSAGGITDLGTMPWGERIYNAKVSATYTVDYSAGLFKLGTTYTAGNSSSWDGYYLCMDMTSTQCAMLLQIDGMEISSSTGYPYAVNMKAMGITVGSKSYPSSLTQVTITPVSNNVGIFAAEDDFGTSYYFRGDVENNYVKFGKNSSGSNMYWRIIRINGDGSIRMIYDGTSAYANGTNNVNRKATESAFKASPYNNNAYIGYMYGTIGSDVAYIYAHSNSYDSTIKTTLDNWYKTNISNTGYYDKVVDAIYCNDRSLVSGTGIGTTATNYGAYGRLKTNKTPSLVCPQSNDKFTTNTALGNGSLTYPVGLITADEVAMAGGVNGQANMSYYLYAGPTYYTMSPYSFTSSAPRIFLVSGDGNLNYSNSSTSHGVKPVISLKADAIKGGAGTRTNPFTT